MYPVALLLMAVRGWWTGNLEAVFAAPLTALLFTLLDYPIVVVVLWLVSRRWSTRPASTRVVAAIALASAAYFAMVWPLGLFHLSAVFMSIVVGATGLAWGVAHLRALRRPMPGDSTLRR
jgi:O-antigen/teichoic acid export membrane protein